MNNSAFAATQRRVSGEISALRSATRPEDKLVHAEGLLRQSGSLSTTSDREDSLRGLADSAIRDNILPLLASPDFSVRIRAIQLIYALHVRSAGLVLNPAQTQTLRRVMEETLTQNAPQLRTTMPPQSTPAHYANALDWLTSACRVFL